MTCEEYEILLSARLDGELTGQEEALLADHLAQCPRCRQTAQQLAQLHEAMTSWNADLPGRLKNRLADQDWSALSPGEEGSASQTTAPTQQNIPGQDPQRKSSRPRFLWLACAAAAVLVAVMVWQLTLPNGRGSGLSQAMMDVFQSVSPSENQEAAKEDAQPSPENDQEVSGEHSGSQSPDEASPGQDNSSLPPSDNPDTPGGDPGQEDPGLEDPSMDDPGTQDPGADDPGTDQPDPPENTLTQQQAQDLLEDYLAGQHRSLSLVSLGSSGGMWRFSGKDASGQVVSFFMVDQANGQVHEVPVPPKDEGPTIGYGP